nr:LamG-like jellyroll fold domain-containing protein [uncultured Bacteroides sp.]
MKVLDYALELLENNPNITPQEMAHNLHVTGYAANDIVLALYKLLEISADENVLVMVAELRHPLVPSIMLIEALKQCPYSMSEIQCAIDKHYPKDAAFYGAILGNGDAFSASNIPAYGFGINDFTIEAFIKPKSSGTIISKKPSAGCQGNGGFLLVLKNSGIVKFATDDGLGFYEVNSEKVSAFDGKWHHVLAYRKNSELEIYWDFKRLSVTPRTNRFPGLNVTNNIRLLVGMTDQIQEEFNYFSGSIGEIRLWNKVKNYKDMKEWNNTDWIETGLVGLWDFMGKRIQDISSKSNALTSIGNISFEVFHRD